MRVARKIFIYTCYFKWLYMFPVSVDNVLPRGLHCQNIFCSGFRQDNLVWCTQSSVRIAFCEMKPEHIY